MRRTVPLLVLIGGTAVLAPVLAVFAQSSSSRSHHPSLVGGAPDEPLREAITCTPCKSAPTSSDDGRIVEELTAILKETRSIETFAVTAMVLGRMGPAAKQAIPAIIRNAERLEVFENLYKTSGPADNSALQEVVEAIEMILDKKGGRTKGRTRPNQSPLYPVPSYGPATCVPCPPAAPYSGPPASVIAPDFTPHPAQQPAKPVEPAKSTPVPTPARAS